VFVEGANKLVMEEARMTGKGLVFVYIEFLVLYLIGKGGDYSVGMIVARLDMFQQSGDFTTSLYVCAMG